MQSAKTLYDVLEVAPAASPETIAAAYRSLCKRFHPDVYPNKQQAEARMREINQAHAVLIDPAQRRAYDVKLAQAAPRVPAAPQAPAQAMPRHMGDVVPPWKFVQPHWALRRFFTKWCTIVCAVIGAIGLMAYWDNLPHQADRQETIQEFYTALHGYVETARTNHYSIRLLESWQAQPLPGAEFGPLVPARERLDQARAAFEDQRNTESANELIHQAVIDYQLESYVNPRDPHAQAPVTQLGEPQVQWWVLDAKTEWLSRCEYFVLGALLGAVTGWVLAALLRASFDLFKGTLRAIFFKRQ